MEWLVGSDDETRVSCLATLKFWVNSIVVHTFDATTNETAPVVFVGTRKDKITNPADHQRISTILFESFSTSLAWPSVVENEHAQGANGRARMFFFPVDNVQGRRDPTVVQLMECVERVIDSSAYVHEERPLSYLQALDKLAALNKSFLSYNHAFDIAVKCGVEPSDVTNMLKLFHEMGSLMFHGRFHCIFVNELLTC
jgi:hypothetical protein